MTIIPVDLRKVRTTRVRCAKKNCRTKDWVLHRHHMGHQYMFVACFQWRHEQARYQAFVENYFQYRDEDVVLVCSMHHREIHERYQPLIEAAIQRVGKPIREFTWADADALMGALITRCNDWLKRSTPGSKRPWPSNGHTKRRAEDAAAYLQQAAGETPF